MKNKKIFTNAIVIFSLGLTFLALSGCGLFGKTKTGAEVGGIDQIPQDRRMGYIESLGGVRTKSRGTHYCDWMMAIRFC